MLHKEKYEAHTILNTDRGIRVEGMTITLSRAQFIILLALPVMVPPSASSSDPPAAM